jgi:hypothetical protein
MLEHFPVCAAVYPRGYVETIHNNQLRKLSYRQGFLHLSNRDDKVGFNCRKNEAVYTLTTEFSVVRLKKDSRELKLKLELEVRNTIYCWLMHMHIQRSRHRRNSHFYYSLSWPFVVNTTDWYPSHQIKGHQPIESLILSMRHVIIWSLRPFEISKFYA